MPGGKGAFLMSIWTLLSLALFALFILYTAAVSALALAEKREEAARETAGGRRLASLSFGEKMRLLNALEEDGARRRKRLPASAGALMSKNGLARHYT